MTETSCAKKEKHIQEISKHLNKQIVFVRVCLEMWAPVNSESKAFAR